MAVSPHLKPSRVQRLCAILIPAAPPSRIQKIIIEGRRAAGGCSESDTAFLWCFCCAFSIIEISLKLLRLIHRRHANVDNRNSGPQNGNTTFAMPHVGAASSGKLARYRPMAGDSVDANAVVHHVVRFLFVVACSPSRRHTRVATTLHSLGVEHGPATVLARYPRCTATA